MENIQRDLAKEIAALQALRPTRKTRSWTLLIMGDHGRVLTIRWFKWISALAVLLLVLAVMAATVLYFLYRRTRDVSAGLHRSLAHIQQEIGGLRNEKDTLMAQLVVTRVEIERLTAKTAPQPVHTSGPQEPAQGPGQMPAQAAEIAPRSEPAAVERPAKTAVDSAAAAAAAAEETPKVAIEELTISHEAAEHIYRVQFILKNTGPESDLISGYTVVVLKEPDSSTDTWLSLPAVKLAAGVPTGRKKGQYFCIARFKTVRSAATSDMDPGRFHSATVLVFDTRENLLLEREYAIHIRESVSSPNG